MRDSEVEQMRIGGSPIGLTLDYLKRQQADVRASLERITLAITALEDIAARDHLDPVEDGVIIPDPDLNGLTIHDAAERVLRDVKAPLHYVELINHLRQRGYAPARDEKFRLSLVGALARKARAHDTFAALGQGKYALREWSEYWPDAEGPENKSAA